MSAGTYLASSFLYINMGCHMMFILKNRLQAQSVTFEKTAKIMNELVTAMFKESFIKTMIIPQEPMSIQTFKDLFRKLAHSSIMKLDNSSMQKLLFLIIMTLKKETFLISSPVELYPLTIGNMKTLASYVQNTQSQQLMENNIKIFSNAASCYSFTQFLEIKEYLLTLLQNYQTKVINFTESGYQNEKGKMIFQRRNCHNQLPIGSVKNHPQINISIPTTKLNFMPLKQWRNWKTSLVIDHASEYEKQSQKRRIKGSYPGSKQKSLDDMFQLNETNVTDFQVQLDLFEYEAEIKSKANHKVQSKQKVEIKNNTASQQSNIKKKINEEFDKLEVGQAEDLDLLQMMDN